MNKSAVIKKLIDALPSNDVCAVAERQGWDCVESAIAHLADSPPDDVIQGMVEAIIIRGGLHENPKSREYRAIEARKVLKGLDLLVT